MLIQLPDGDWLELASIIQVTAVEITSGEWATVGQGPGGHWITLAPRPENKLLAKTEAERLRDVWAADVNKAKADAIKAEATERLTVLHQWRSDRRTKEQAAEMSRWPAGVHTFNVKIEDDEPTLVDTLIDPQPSKKEDTTPDQQPPLPVRKIQMERRPYPFTVGEFTPADPQPSSVEYHKSRNQPPLDPIYHCPRCGTEAPRSQWGVLGLGVLPDGDDPRRCAACWFSGYSVIPCEGPLPDTATAEHTDDGILLPSEQLSPCPPYSQDKIAVDPGGESWAMIDLRLEPTSLGLGEVLPPKVNTITETDKRPGETWRDRAIREPLL